MTSAPAIAGEDVVLTTPQATLVGSSDEYRGTLISSFKGIPYAVPPVGVRRWQPPGALTLPEGEVQAKVYAPACIQPEVPKTDFYYNPPALTSEDCLYLNVWTGTKPADQSLMPTMVFIHGGALLNGSGSDSLYDGAALASKGVVVVTINYRLHVFGYFSHPGLNSESPRGASGNYGTLDQIQALKWVQQNIAAFGGDPNNITIFGESAGALSVSHLMATPLAAGLFHRAIMQSSYLPPGLQMSTARFGKEAALVSGQKLAQAAGVSSLVELRQLSARELMQAARAINFYPETVVDGYVFPVDVNVAFDTGRQHDVPLLAGFNSGEAYPFEMAGLVPPVPRDEPSYVAEVRMRYGDLADSYLEIYPAADPRDSVLAASRDGFFGWATMRFVRSMLNVNSSAYLYYFDHETPAARAMGVGAFHAGELPFVFDNLNRGVSYPPNWPAVATDASSVKMATVVSGYWVAFAKQGKPAADGLPEWRPYTDASRNFMAFKDGKAVPGVNLMPGMFELYDRIVEARRREGKVSWGLHEIGLFAPVLSER